MRLLKGDIPASELSVPMGRDAEVWRAAYKEAKEVTWIAGTTTPYDYASLVCDIFEEITSAWDACIWCGQNKCDCAERMGCAI